MKNTSSLLKGIGDDVVEKERAVAIANNLFLECLKQSSKTVLNWNQKEAFYKKSLEELADKPFFRWMNYYPEIFED